MVGKDFKSCPGAVVGKFDFNTSSTIELTGCVTEAKKNGYQIDTNKVENNQQHRTSDFGTFLHVVKSSLGTGVLASASGFRDAGVVVGIVGTILIGILCAYCTHIMVDCAQQMCTLLKVESLGFGETVEETFKNCKNKTCKKYSSCLRHIADYLMFVTYYGVCTIYILLVAETLKQIVENHMEISWNIRIYIMMTGVPVYLVGMIRTIKYLVPFSAIANLSLLVSLCLIFYLILQDLPPISDRPMSVSVLRLPSFIATVMFGMEGIGTMLPVESSMKNRTHFLGCPGVLNFAMAIVVALFLSVGLLGYVKFGDASQGSVTLNLNSDIFSEIIKGLVALAILFTFGLQLTASIDVLWRGVQSRFKQQHKTQAYYLIRASLILGAIIIALLVPNLGPIISLIGAFGFSTCGILFPALAETALCLNKSLGKWNWILWKNVLIFIFGILAAVCGSIVAIGDIINQYQ